MRTVFSNLEARLAPFDDKVATNLALLSTLAPQTRIYYPGQTLFEPGSGNDVIFLVQSGWSYRYGSLNNGRHQVVNFILPGDVMSPSSLACATAFRGVIALTRLQVYIFEKHDLVRLSHEHPNLYLAWLELAGLSITLLEERIVSLGCRNAYERTLHLILELWCRLRAVDHADSRGFFCPVRQSQFAEALGLSTVHMSRTFGRLRRDGIIDLDNRRHRLTILHEQAAIEACGFDDGYLTLRSVAAP